MTGAPATDVDRLYEQAANRLLVPGLVGFGISAAQLIDSGIHFHDEIVPHGSSFADFFRRAGDHHVSLTFSVALDRGDAATCADLHGFLEIVLAWIEALPPPLVGKSPLPLSLVVVGAGGRDSLGTHLLIEGGPSFIHWERFRALRTAAGYPDYEPLRESIEQTLVHELIGHQLAFCTVGGPLLTPAEMRGVFEVTGLRHLRFRGGDLVSIDAFLAGGNLLDGLRRLEYPRAHDEPERYLDHVAELVAFAIEGAESTATRPYHAIRDVLKLGLLLANRPLARSPNGDRELREGYWYDGHRFVSHFVERHADGESTETLARDVGARWLTLAACLAEARREAPRLYATPTRQLVAGARVLLQVGLDAYLAAVGDELFMVSAFGVVRNPGGDAPEPAILPALAAKVRIVKQPGGSDPHVHFRFENCSDAVVPYRILPLAPELLDQE